MRVLITDLVPEGLCEFSGKTGECLKVVLDANAPPALVSTTHFVKLVRFQAQQELKRAAQPVPAAAARERSTPVSG